MDKDLSLSNKKHTDMLFEQTTSPPQETLESYSHTQMHTSAFSPPITFSEENKWLLAVRSFEATNSISKIIIENLSSSSSTPGF